MNQKLGGETHGRGEREREPMSTHGCCEPRNPLPASLDQKKQIYKLTFARHTPISATRSTAAVVRTPGSEFRQLTHRCVGETHCPPGGYPTRAMAGFKDVSQAAVRFYGTKIMSALSHLTRKTA